MKEEQAREAARAKYHIEREHKIALPMMDIAFDYAWHAALEYANRWTYCEDALPTEMGKYWITTQYGDMSQDSWNGVSWATYLPNHVIAWRPLPEAAEIKRSEDDV